MKSIPFSQDIFIRKEINYNLRIEVGLTFTKAATASAGTKSIKFRGSIIWNSTLDVIKSRKTVSVCQKHKDWTG